MNNRINSLRCPYCAKNNKGMLKKNNDKELKCVDCNRLFSVVNNIPILLTKDGDFYSILGKQKK